MTQEQINKLQELKKLLDAGILTEEEMQTEKAKILGTAKVVEQNEITANKVSSETIKAEDTIKDSDTNIELVTDQIVASGKSNKRNLILAIVGAVVVGLVVWATSSKNKAEATYSEPEYHQIESVDEGPAPVMETNENEANVSDDASTDDDEFGLDPWNGNLNIVGDIYRTCSTLAQISFNKTGKGMYEGTMDLMLGEAETDPNTFQPTGRLFDDQGHLTGKLRAKVDGQTLTVVLDSYTISKPSEFFDDLYKSQQIFRLTYDGQSYSAQAVGKMQTFFDSIEIK